MSLVGGRIEIQRVSKIESFVVRFAKRHYRPGLDFVGRYRGQTLAAATTLVLVSAAVLPFLGSEFIPKLDE